MNSFEIEIKSLLGSPARAEDLKKKMHHIDPNTKKLSHHKQLNHYFVGGDVEKLYELLALRLKPEDQEKLKAIIEQGNDFSVRTRLADEKILFVIKASIDEGTSHNSVSRREFETEIKGMTLDELDSLIQEAGFSYQAKWSREREEYVCRDINVCLDRNAGYGYLAEFEKVVGDESSLPQVKKYLQKFMDELGVEALPQDRLERMFAYYNEHWPEYYGTDKIFFVE